MLSKVTQNLIQPINDSVVELTVVASNAQVHKTPIPNLTAVSTPVADNIKNLVVAARKTLEHSIIQSKSFLRGNLEVEHENKIKSLLPKIDEIGVRANLAGNALVKNCEELAKSPLHPDYLNGLVECLKTILLSTQDLLNIWDESEVLRILSVSKSLRERIQVLRASDFNQFVKQPQLLLEVTKPVYQLAVMLMQLVKTRANELINASVAQFLESEVFLLSQMSPLQIAVSKCMFEYVQVVAAMSNKSLNVNMKDALHKHCDIANTICNDIESALQSGDLIISLLPKLNNSLPNYDQHILVAKKELNLLLKDLVANNITNNKSFQHLFSAINEIISASKEYAQYYIPSGRTIIRNYCLMLSEEASSLNEGLSLKDNLLYSISSIQAISSGLYKLQQSHQSYSQQSLKQRLENKDPLCIPLLTKLLSQFDDAKPTTDAIQYICLHDTLLTNQLLRTNSLQMIQSYRESLGDEFSQSCQVSLHEKLVLANFHNTCDVLYNLIFNIGKSNLINNDLLIQTNVASLFETPLLQPHSVDISRQKSVMKQANTAVNSIQQLLKSNKLTPQQEQQLNQSLTQLTNTLGRLKESPNNQRLLNQLTCQLQQLVEHGVLQGSATLQTLVANIMQEPALLSNPLMNANLCEAITAYNTTNDEQLNNIKNNAKTMATIAQLNALLRTPIKPLDTLMHRFSAFMEINPKNKPLDVVEQQQLMQQHVADLEIFYPEHQLERMSVLLQDPTITDHLEDLKYEVASIPVVQAHPLAHGTSLLMATPNNVELLKHVKNQVGLLQKQQQDVINTLLDANNRQSMVELLNYLKSQDLLLLPLKGDLLLHKLETLLEETDGDDLQHVMHAIADYKQGDIIGALHEIELVGQVKKREVALLLEQETSKLQINNSEISKLQSFIKNELNNLQDGPAKRAFIEKQGILMAFVNSRDIKGYQHLLKAFEFTAEQVGDYNGDTTEFMDLMKLLQQSVADFKINTGVKQDKPVDKHVVAAKKVESSTLQRNNSVHIIPKGVEFIELNEDTPLPVTESELRDNPVQAIAKDLKIQTSRWVADGNTIVQAATRLSDTLGSLSISFENITPESRLKIVKESKALVFDSDELIKYAMELANICPDKRLREQVVLACERVPSSAQQLRILMNVKMSSGNNKDTEDQLISSASNLSEAVGSVLWACESAYVKVNSSAAYVVTPGTPSKYSSFRIKKYKNGTVNKEHSPIMKTVTGGKLKSKHLQEVRAMDSV